MHNVKKQKMCSMIRSRRRFFSPILFLLLLILTVPCFPEVINSSSSFQAKHKVRSSPTSVAKPLIVLDAGHGGTDEGAKVKWFKEKKITLATVLYTKKYLEQLGYRVILTRGKDVSLSLPKRVAIANKVRSSLFVSIHFNASANPSAKGIEVFYYNAKEADRTRSSRRLANCVLHFILDQTQASSRGVKAGNFHVIRETTMPAVLVEGGFVTNPEECSYLKRREYLEHIAKGVAQGIDNFLKS